jgi:formylglycine-generating enzyme required for sulfatase activity/dienelactone hydrolase
MDKVRILESWKEISAHLGRNIRTCQLWEREYGLPVHRLDGSPKARVFAYAEELDRWLRRVSQEREPGGEGRDPGQAKNDLGSGSELQTLPPWNIGLIAGLVVLAVAAVAVSAFLLVRQSRVRWANDIAIPELERLVLSPDEEKAYELALRVEKIAPSSLRLAQLMPLVSGNLAVETYPPGAEAYVRPYDQPEAPWQALGRTPVEGRRVSKGPKHWRVVRAGFSEAEGSVNVPSGDTEAIRIQLEEEARTPKGMVHVPGDICALRQFQVRSAPPLALGDFWIDRYEVSNREYGLFVEAGGYEDPRFWRFPFEQDGRTLSWEEAMRILVDRSGRPGPATWEQGACPAGREDYPVTGISWYEAAAYAEFTGKRLPSAYHWNLAAGLMREMDYVVPSSNLGGQALAPTGAFRGLGCHGTYDMAGNAKEWCSNEAGGDRVNLGGAWNEAQYWFFLFDHYPPFMRADNFGFRCMKDVGAGETVERAHARLAIRPEPDYAAMTPCPDAVFEAYRSLYGYTRTDLAARVDSRRDWSPDTILEKVSFLDAGGGARIVAYLFLPRKARPPYQSVVYVPGSSAFSLDSIFDYSVVRNREAELFTRGGRAFVFPVLWNTFERRERSLPPRSREFLRDRMIRHHRELARTLDYLETRPDFDTEKIAYQGLSWGAYAGPVHLALEKRFKAAIFVGGGFYWEMHDPDRGSPEWDTINFAPRVDAPVLMQQGRYDAFYPLDTNARLFFQLLGTPEADKYLIVYPTGHSVWLLNESRRDMFGFLDKYLGRPDR